MSAKFQELAALILLSVAIFIHSSKFASIGTLFIGVTAELLTALIALGLPLPLSPFVAACLAIAADDLGVLGDSDAAFS